MADPIVNTLGIVGMKHCGAYDSATSYEKLNVVTYQGSSYCAKGNTVGNLPTNTTYWDLLAQKGATGPQGETGPQGPKPVKGVDYYTAEDVAEMEASLNSDVTAEVSEQLSDLTSATPLVASSVAGMTDTTRIYVLTTDGHWYWYDGTDWQDGGVYQATGIDPDDPVILSKLDKQITWTPEELTLNDYIYNSNHQQYPASETVPYEGAVISNFPSGTYKITCQSLNSSYIGCWIEKSGMAGLVLAGYTDHVQIYTDYEVTIPSAYNGGTLYINGRHDTAPVTIKDKSTQSSADFWEEYNELKSTVDNVKKIKQLCVRKGGSDIYIFKQGFKENKDLCIQISKKLANNLFDFKYFWECNNSSDTVLNTLPELSERTIINGGDTDYIAPSIVYAKNNVNGDFADFTSGKFTGGWHGYNNANGSGTPTARLVSAKCYVDNVEVETNEYLKGEHAKIVLVQNLQGSNTEKSDGTGREILQQTITIETSINDEKIYVSSELKALEDVAIVAHYGLSYYRTNNSNTCYFKGSRNIKGPWTYETTRLLPDKNTLETVEYISSVDDTFIMGRDPIFDLGTYYENTNSYGILLSSYKTYLQFINHYIDSIENALNLNANEVVRWKAYYIIQPTE